MSPYPKSYFLKAEAISASLIEVPLLGMTNQSTSPPLSGFRLWISMVGSAFALAAMTAFLVFVTLQSDSWTSSRRNGPPAEAVAQGWLSQKTAYNYGQGRDPGDAREFFRRHIGQEEVVGRAWFFYPLAVVTGIMGLTTIACMTMVVTMPLSGGLRWIRRQRTSPTGRTARSVPDFGGRDQRDPGCVFGIGANPYL